MVMTLRDPATCHRAIATRDARFDGVFYLGVTSTKIYCRLICRARRPRPENCRFFLHAAAAGPAGFRPCRHYRPEQAPGYAPVDATGTMATVAVRAIEAGALGGDPLPAASLKAAPGLRLPGTIDPFETAIRTIIGQQVSVSTSTTVMGRVVEAFGDSILTPWPTLNRLTITPDPIARESVDSLAPLALNTAHALLAVALAVDSSHPSLAHSPDPERTIARLQEPPGMGQWTAHYFRMRIPGWPDDCIAGDLVVRKALAPLTPRQTEARSAARRPCRGDAERHRWRSSSFFKCSDCPILP
jgi:hypothetical protein